MEALGWDRPPANLADFLSNWLPLGCNDYHLKLFQFAVVTWAIWVNRNKMTIEKTFPTSPIDVLYKSDVFMQQWRILLRDDDRQKLETYRNLSKRMAEELFKQSAAQDCGGHFPLSSCLY